MLAEMDTNHNSYQILFLIHDMHQRVQNHNSNILQVSDLFDSVLKNNLVEDTLVVYIGKAGGSNSRATLHSRLKQYMRFGEGKPVGHWGGRLIWQLENHRELTVCYKTLANSEPREEEKKLILEFESIHGKIPFANLAH